jgi:hypothetical protein
MNLAFIGFTVVSVVLSIYASTFYSLAGKRLPVFMRSYSLAYFSLALTFLIWAFASLNNEFLKNFVIIGDSLLLLGSILLLNVLFNQNKNIKIFSIVTGVILSLIFIWLRINYYQPMPFIENGILVFNTQTIVAVILNLVFILIWLPANLVAAKKVTANISIEGMTYAYSFIYGVSTIAAILFITFKTIPMVIISFVALGICFVMLLYSNYVINKLLPTKL